MRFCYYLVVSLLLLSLSGDAHAQQQTTISIGTSLQACASGLQTGTSLSVNGSKSTTSRSTTDCPWTA